MEQPFRFTLKGRQIEARAEEVVKALRGVAPERVRRHAVEIGRIRYPIKQAFAVAFGVERTDFSAYWAQRVFLGLGFPLSTSATDQRSRPKQEAAGATKRTAPRVQGGVRPRFPRAKGLGRPDRFEEADDGMPAAQVQSVEIPPIVLAWSPWQRWTDLAKDGRQGASPYVPFKKPGVYEVIEEPFIERLAIGRASNLRRRVKEHLVRGTASHHAGELIRAHEDPTKLRVRWAVTDRPAAVEEELHLRHIRQHGKLPKYTQRT